MHYPSKKKIEGPEEKTCRLQWHEYVGNLHIHTSDSDGAWDIDRIVSAAQKKTLDFIGITDHSHMAGVLRKEYSGLRAGVLVLVGLEIGIRHNHYLAFGIKGLISETPAGPQSVIDVVNEQGGVGFMAHPFEKGMPFLEKSVAYVWKDLSVSGYTGICIWNFSSRFKERIRTLLHAVFCLMLKRAALKGPDSEVLSFWDEACSKRRVVAIGGSDAHGTSIRFGPLSLTPLPYEFALGSINVHILVEGHWGQRPALREPTVIEALREGRLYVAHDNLCPAGGFRFTFKPEGGRELVMGQEAVFSPGVFKVTLPRPGMIRMIKDGVLYKTAQGADMTMPVKTPGVYRVEAYHRLNFFGWRPWVFSNPIYLR